MAIIIHCKKCGKRSFGAADQCPRCEGIDLRFIIDYWPHGRNGKRIYQSLPESNNTAQKAQEIATLMKKSRQEKFVPASPKGTTVMELFPQYLDWYELYRGRARGHPLKGPCQEKKISRCNEFIFSRDSTSLP